MRFTVEEMIMMKSFEHGKREEAVASIEAEMPAMVDQDLKEMCVILRNKLTSMSDEAFKQIDFTVYDQELADA